MLLYDASGRKLRRVIGYARDWVAVDEAAPEVDAVADREIEAPDDLDDDETETC